ncbi:MAG: DUF4321 domain-containing protein [Bacillota bacterium]
MSTGRRRYGLGFTILLVLTGAFMGTLAAHLAGDVLPFLLMSLSFGLEPPVTLRLWDLFSLTLGCTFRFNVGGALGILIALLLFRRG